MSKEKKVKDVISELSKAGEKSVKAINNKISNELTNTVGVKNYPSKVKSKGAYKPDSLDSMLNAAVDGTSDTNGLIVPLDHIVSMSLNYDIKTVCDMILNSHEFNPEITVSKDVLIPSKFTENYDGKLKESENSISGRVIKDIIPTGNGGKLHIILDNRFLIGEKEVLNTMDSINVNAHYRILKDRLPKKLVDLITSGKMGRFETINIGRIGNDLAIPLNIEYVFKNMILPHIIKMYDNGIKDVNLSDNSIRTHLTKTMSLSEIIIKDNRLYVAFRCTTGNGKSKLLVVVPRENFTMLNLSFKADRYCALVGQLAETLVNKKGSKDVKKNIFLETVSNTVPGISDILYVGTSNFTGEVSHNGKLINDEIYINSNNNPLYLPVIELDRAEYSNKITGPLANTTYGPLLANSYGVIDFAKIVETFGELLVGGHVFVKSSDMGKIVILPNIQKTVLSLINKYISGNYSDMSVSCTSNATDISFAILTTNTNAK